MALLGSWLMRVPGSDVVVTVTGAQAYELVNLAGSLYGVGTDVCPVVFGGACLGLASPIARLGEVWTDVDGMGDIVVFVPDLPRGEACFQVAVIRGPGGLNSELGEVVCRPLVADDDGDGVLDDDDVTGLYNEWQAGTVPNYGVQLRPVSNNNQWAWFYSSAYADDPALRPRRVIAH